LLSLVVQKLQPTIMTTAVPLRPVLQASYGGLEPAQQDRAAALEAQGAWQSRHKVLATLRMLSRIAQKSVDNFVI
jgi:arginine/lysine/ornithine decarboxylase